MEPALYYLAQTQRRAGYHPSPGCAGQNHDTMNFRQWIQEKWYEHLAELEAYGFRPQITPVQYFNTYKHWLRREYRHQQQQHNGT